MARLEVKGKIKILSTIDDSEWSHLKYQVRHPFTLIELLMVILVISMTVFLATRGQTKSFQKSELRKSVQEIVLASQYASLLAIESQQPVVLNLDTLKKEMKVLVSTREKRIKPIKKDPLFKMRPLSEMVNFENIQVQPLVSEINQSKYEEHYRITYHPDGRCDKAMIVIGVRDLFYSIHTSPFTGKTTVLEGVQALESEVIDLDAI